MWEEYGSFTFAQLQKGHWAASVGAIFGRQWILRCYTAMFPLGATMFFRVVFIASLLGLASYSSVASANSCSNVDAFSPNDESGLRKNEFGIYAVGTFRIEGEEDESKQPMFNLTKVDYENELDDAGRASMECKVTQAVVWAHSGKPEQDKPDCSLDVDTSIYNEGAPERRAHRH